MTSLMTLQVLSNDILLIKKIISKTFVIKKLSVYINFWVALLDPDTTHEIYIFTSLDEIKVIFMTKN